MSPLLLLVIHMVGPWPTVPHDRNLTLLYNLDSEIFFALGFICNSRATFLLIYSGIRRHTYPRCSEPLSHSVSDIERLSIRLNLLIAPSSLPLDDFLEFQFERCLYATFTEIAPRYLSCALLRPSRVSPPYSPPLNLGTRFLVVEEICNIPRITLQQSLMISAKSSCFTKLNHVGVISQLKSLLWILFKFKVKFEVA